MLLQSIIQQSNDIQFEPQPLIAWNAATDGNYNALTGIYYTDIWTPTSENDRTYNHHPFIIEFGGYLHAVFSTHSQDEEGSGEYIRYSKSTDMGATLSTPITIFDSQDDITRDWTLGGRVCVSAGFAVVGDKLYGITDVNDRAAGGEDRARLKVGVMAREINMDGTFGTAYWIENGDGSLIAPEPISGYPSFAFNATLRNQVRQYYYDNPDKRTDWYFSVLNTDLLYSQYSIPGVRDFNGNDLAEPRRIKLPSGQYLKIWRNLASGSNRKVIQTSEDALTWNAPYQSNIPDSPSRTMALTLSNGIIAVIGNNEGAVRTPLFLALSNDGLNFESANIYNIDTETSGAVFSGFGKGTGVQYPHATQLSNGKLCVVYSVNKEDIRAAIFDIPNLN